MLPNCYRASLKDLKTPKPSPPELINIQIAHDLKCQSPEDQLLCKIIKNQSKLLKYICKLEEAPVWMPGGEKLCDLFSN